MTTPTMEEEKRIEVIQRVFRGEVTMVEAALVLGVSERHNFRIKARMSQYANRGVHRAGKNSLDACRSSRPQRTPELV
jgi:hypothetical protein